MKTTEFFLKMYNLTHMIEIMEAWEVKMHNKSEILTLFLVVRLF
jgi:hypothetical protein